jgi:hypothetical protein
MAYVSQELKAKIAPNVKAILKKYKLKGSLSVNNHSTLVLTLKSGKIDFAENFNATCVVRDPADVAINRAKGHIQVNTYHYQKQYTGKAVKFFDEVMVAMKGDTWFDKSDIMTDYFHVAYYISINVGKWNKDYEVI